MSAAGLVELLDSYLVGQKAVKTAAWKAERKARRMVGRLERKVVEWKAAS